MSTVRVRSLTGSPASAEALSELGQKLVSLSIEGLREGGQRLADLLAPVLDEIRRPQQMPTLRPAGPCCAIPERECPPRCVCEICWEAAADEELVCTVRVRNSSSRTRTFDVSATELVGPGGSLGTMTVTPQQLTLPPDRSGLVQAALTVLASAGEGCYEGEILVRGAYEQCVRVLVKVVAKSKCRCEPQDCICEMVQGDPPVRIRAHQWYDHFQCTDACAPDLEREHV